jgi:hypothetical protein
LQGLLHPGAPRKLKERFVGTLQIRACEEAAMGQADPLNATPLKAVNPSSALAPDPVPLPLNKPAALHALRPAMGSQTGSANSSDGKMHRVAKQFEAMFMTEMLRQAHPKSGATGVFRQGIGEQQMQPFMDQALGDAMAAHGGTGLTKIIERALNAAAAAKVSTKGTK